MADVCVGDRVLVRCWTQPYKTRVRVVKEIDGLQARLAVEVDGKETENIEWEYLEDLKRVEEADGRKST